MTETVPQSRGTTGRTLHTSDASRVLHALSTRERQRVVEADTPRFWKLTWSVIGDPADGTS